jgi:flagellar secretion chaperone FliS
MARHNAQSYRKAQINTASPGQRVVMMYEGLLKEIKKARHAMLKIDEDIGQIEVVNNSIALAQQIILELRLALDKDKGGEIASSLEDLYNFWVDKLSDANIKKDPKILNPLIEMIGELHVTWKQATIKARQIGA